MNEPEKQNTLIKERWLLLLIFLAAITLRLIYLSELKDSPLLYYPGLDPAAYDLWARRIAAGDWLGREVFYQSPLYPYLLGIFYALFGRHLFWVYILQILAGSIDCLLIYGIGKRVFGTRAGFLAGLFAAVYKPFIFYDVALLKTFLEVFLIDLCIYLLLRAGDRKKPATIFLAGLILGLGSLARDNFLILVFWFYPWLWYQLNKSRCAARSSWFLAGFALIIGISGIRNRVVGKDFVLTTSQAGQNLYIGNHLKNLTGTYTPPDFVTANPSFEQTDFRNEAIRRTGLKQLTPSQVSNFWIARTFQEIRLDPKLFLERLLLKLGLFWNRKEIADNVSYYLTQIEFSFLLRMPLLDFGLIMPFSILGMILALRKKRGILLFGYVLIYWLSVSLFFIFARYRLAVIGPLLVYAGFSLEILSGWVKGKNWKKIAAAMILLATAAGLTLSPLIVETLDYAYYNLGNSYARAGKFPQAVSAYRKALLYNPAPAEFWINLGIAASRVGDLDQSLNAFAEAVVRDPDNANGHLGFGIALYQARYFSAAEKELERALTINPNLSQARVYLELIQSKQKGG